MFTSPWGFDGLHPRVMMLVDAMAGMFSIIYRSSWESGKVPADRKPASVTTVYTRGMREDLGNCRLLV